MGSMMKGISGRQDARASESESGVALIMALLALLLLTAVGLTLATSTSTEVQVAANYRWSLQALYNAEAGVELAKNVLVGADWTAHPTPRSAASWDPASITTPPTLTVNTSVGATLGATEVGEPGRIGPLMSDGTIGTTVTRDFEMGKCDRVGNGMGYGVVMPDLAGTGAALGAALENRTTYGGKSLNGAFTLWYRKPHMYGADGKVHDFGNPQSERLSYADVVIVVSEGVAPYQASASATAAQTNFAAAHQAVQIVEATLYGPPTIPVCEAELSAQAGSGPGGAGVDPCAQAAASFDTTKMGVDVAAANQGTATRHTYK